MGQTETGEDSRRVDMHITASVSFLVADVPSRKDYLLGAARLNQMFFGAVEDRVFGTVLFPYDTILADLVPRECGKSEIESEHCIVASHISMVTMVPKSRVWCNDKLKRPYSPKCKISF